MLKIFEDIRNYSQFKLNQSNFSVGFFCENNYILQYLKPYILLKSKKKKILVISFDKLNLENQNNIKIFVFKTKFFRELAFLTIKLNYLYSSTPGLNSTIFKKSKLSKCKYIYLQHAPVSLTMVYMPDAFDSFDAIQTINTFQFKEMNEIKNKKKLKIKVFRGKYIYLSNYKSEIESHETDLLIAPTWNSKFYELKCHLKLKELLEKNNISYILRPHPMSLIKKELSIEDLKKNNIKYDLSFKADLKKFRFLLSDWSGIFIEYAIVSNQLAYLINTPKKVLNENYENYNNSPIEVVTRNIFGKTFDIDNLDKLVQDLKKNKDNFEYLQKNLKNKDLEKNIKDIFYI